jgi:NADH dehydrogenase (ubiquinone) 1 alpha subcomplex subunit 9
MLGRTLVNALGNTKHPIDSPVGKKGTTIVAPHRGTDDDKRHLKVMADLGKLVQTVFILAYSDYNLV